MSYMTTNMSAAAEEIRTNIQAILPEIEANAEEVDRTGICPQHILKKLEEAGAFRSFVPVQFGGSGLSLGELCQIIEDVSYYDGSIGWQMMINAGSQAITARLPIETLAKMYADGPDTFCKGAAAPKCMAKPVEGGYMIKGEWPLASGQREFTWINLGFMVKDPEGMRMDPGGYNRPDLKVAVIPGDKVEIIKTWDSVGMRGSGSDSIRLEEETFVPEEWTCSLFGDSSVDEPFLGMRMPHITGPAHAAMAMGILRAAIDHLATEALTRKPAFAPTTIMKDEPVFRSRFGEIMIASSGDCLGRR